MSKSDTEGVTSVVSLTLQAGWGNDKSDQPETKGVTSVASLTLRE